MKRRAVYIIAVYLLISCKTSFAGIMESFNEGVNASNNLLNQHEQRAVNRQMLQAELQLAQANARIAQLEAREAEETYKYRRRHRERDNY